MAASAGYSKRSSSVKRLLQEAKELATETTMHDGIYAAPFEENLYDWHFTIEGPKDSEFEGGLYHGRITLPPQYPFKAPDIMLLTPNGRFELNKKVCLTITGFHEESWQPAWGIRTALVGLSSFFTTEAKGAIGGLDAPASERKRLAALSRDWTCPGCQMKNCEILPPRPEEKKSEAAVNEENKTSPKAAVCEAAKELPEQNAESPQGKEDITEAPKQAVQPIMTLPDSPAVSASTTATSKAATKPSLSPETVEQPASQPSSSSSNPFTSRPNRADSMSRQEVVDRHLQVVELLTRQLALNDPSSNVHHAPSAGQSVAFAAPASNSAARGNGAPVNGRATAPPVWLDGAIGAVFIALASLILRKVM